MGLIARALFLLAVATTGCASVDGARIESRIDILVMTTDRETTDALLDRLQGVERLPAAPAQAGSWFRGRLAREGDGRVYTIMVASGESPDEATMETMARRTIKAWRPRYVLAIGTTSAVAHEGPLGAVGVVSVICDFDLETYERVEDPGDCFRSDGGLLVAALAVAPEWQAAATSIPTREDCLPARFKKMGAFSGDPDSDPRFVEVVTKISKQIHRGLVMESAGVSVARAIGDLRRELREPIGFLMIRSISEVRSPGENREEYQQSRDAESRLRQTACAAQDGVDFAVELIRRRWPVLPSATH
jgi:hypothetical protein